MAPLLGYWKIRGLAQPIRLLLAHTGTEFEEKFYLLGPPPEFDRSQWYDEKFNLGLDFPNLPYYVEGDLKLTQNLAIARHIARKHNLDGKTEAEKMRIDLVEQQLIDDIWAFVRVDYANYLGGDFEKAKAEYMINMPGQLERMSKFLGDRKWLAGDNLTYVDFYLFEHIDKLLLFAPDEVKKYGNLVRHLKQIEDLPNVKKFMQSDRYIKWPFNNDCATWGSILNKSMAK